jgi:DNA mismatch repair protein MutS2
VPPSQRKAVRRMRETLEVGDRVLVKALNQSGEIISLSNKDAEVALGRLKTRVSLTELKLLEEARDDDEPVQATVSTRRAPAPFRWSSTSAARRSKKGLARLESYMDSAILSELPYVRIIHGKGTGRLREAVRDSLRRDPGSARGKKERIARVGPGSPSSSCRRLISRLSARH